MNHIRFFRLKNFPGHLLAVAAAVALTAFSASVAAAQYVVVGPPDASGAVPIIDPARPDHPLVAVPAGSGGYVVIDPNPDEPQRLFEVPQLPSAPQAPSFEPQLPSMPQAPSMPKAPSDPTGDLFIR